MATVGSTTRCSASNTPACTEHVPDLSLDGSALFATQFVQAEPRFQPPLSDPPLQQWPGVAGDVWAGLYREATGYRVRFPDLADFLISPDGRQVQVHPVPGVSDETIGHLYRNQTLPLALSRRGQLVLHGSAIAVDGGALGFVGPSGRGKSTLAASFAVNGHPFLTDDGLVLDESGGVVRVLPSHPSVRLWGDSQQAVLPGDIAEAPPLDFTPKARLLADAVMAFCDQPLAIRALYFLGEPGADGPDIQPCGPRDALIACARNSFVLDIDERTFLREHHERLTRLVHLVPCFHLSVPRDFARLPEVRRFILLHAAEGAPRSMHKPVLT